MIKILVADDHPVVRAGIRQIVAEADDIAVVDESGDGRMLLEQARTVEHDLVVLDLSMPGTDSLDVLTQLKREHPSIPVLVLTMHASDQFAMRVFRAGASGYLTKDTAAVDLLDAVRKVASGRRYLSQAVAESLAAHLAAADVDVPPHERLSNREYQIFRMIADGRSTGEIAQALSLSGKTVSTYRARIFEKMGMKRPAELAAYAVRNRLTD
jgi:two-component system, NarL family, invasion response regulator UvrY